MTFASPSTRSQRGKELHFTTFVLTCQYFFGNFLISFLPYIIISAKISFIHVLENFYQSEIIVKLVFFLDFWNIISYNYINMFSSKGYCQ